MGWGKQIGPIRKTKLRGTKKVGFRWVLILSGYNLVRMRNIFGVAVANGTVRNFVFVSHTIHPMEGATYGEEEARRRH